MAIDLGARVDPGARIDETAAIGAFAVIGPNVTIGPGTEVGPHTVITGHTEIGRDNRIAAFVSLGDEPQDRSYRGEPTRLVIGDRNVIREYASIHRGTVDGNGATTLGNDNFIMAYTHVAHDCVLGHGITMANGASLAGHVQIDDHCVLSGFALVYQFRRIGTLAFIAYSSGVVQDVPAFVRAAGSPARPNGVNTVGMRRAGYASTDIRALKDAYCTLYRLNLRLEEARAAIRKAAADNEAVALLSASLERADQGVVR